MNPIDSEGNWLASLPYETKSSFLARLSHLLTVAGRSSYKPGTEELDNPIMLRRVNEIQHRVTACLSQLLSMNCEISFQKSIAAWVLGQDDDELNRILQFAWKSAKEGIVK